MSNSGTYHPLLSDLANLEQKTVQEHLSFFRLLLNEFEPQTDLKFAPLLAPLEERIAQFLKTGQARGEYQECIEQMYDTTCAVLDVIKNHGRRDKAFYGDVRTLVDAIRRLIKFLEY